MPHSKTFLRIDDENRVKWVLHGSHNLSKAAWGVEEKAGTQVHIRSFELSVLFLPEDFGLENFNSDSFPILLETDFKKYSDQAEPWLVDQTYTDVDDFNSAWTPSKN